MSKRPKALKFSTAESIKGRIGMILLGTWAVGYGLFKLRSEGPFVYYNDRGLPLYPGGVLALGIFCLVVAFVPAGKWLERFTATKRKRKKTST